MQRCHVQHLLMVLSALLQAPQPAYGAAFPGFQDPRTADPPLPHPASSPQPCARVAPVVDAELSGYGQVVRGRYSPPDAEACSCAGRKCWSQVVLEFRGFVKGVQFDRFGAVWFRGVELLRTTTPEPSPEGIAWRVDRDVTDFEELFGSEGELMVSIPNVVDHTYTGVLHVNASLAFYASTHLADDSDASIESWTVLPLRNASQFSNPIASLTTAKGSAGQANMVQLADPSLGPAIEARLDVFASGHGCEEFWYTNVPGTSVPSGACGGGAYREIIVLVDGQLAGACHPFPVIYTGGVNPLLWRPLTGISSFDVTPYQFDLTPFLAWLNDGKPHNITLQVWGNNPTGFWVLDGVLLLRHGRKGETMLGGQVDVVLSAVPNVTETVHKDTQSSSLQTMRGQHSYRVRGQVQLSSGETLKSEVSGELSARSTNRALGSDTQITDGLLHSSRTSIRGSQRVTTYAGYPFYVFDYGAQDKVSMMLNASVQYARLVTTLFESTTGEGSAYSIQSHNRIQSRAAYNRSLTNHSKIYIQWSQSVENFSLQTDGQLCYREQFAAQNGTITAGKGEYNCTWPRGIYACGASLCGSLGPAVSEVVASERAWEETTAGTSEAASHPVHGLMLTARRPARGSTVKHSPWQQASPARAPVVDAGAQRQSSLADLKTRVIYM